MQTLHDTIFLDDGGTHSLPEVPHLHVHDINHSSCLSFVKKLAPDAVVVNGTNLLRAPWFSAENQPARGILNIHTGLSPYSRGGNCNLFAILHGQLQAVGVTVHLIDSGIDSGAIVYSDRPRFTQSDCYLSLEKKVFRLGEDLMLLALKKIEKGNVAATPQWTGGRLFLKRTGYNFEPYLHVLADKRLREGGLLEAYFRFKEHYDNSVVVLRPTEDPSLWRHPLV